MARIRSVHPGQWKSGEFLECTPLARLLALSLRNIADDHGVFRWKPKTIKIECLPADNCDVDALLAELVDNEQIEKYEVGGKEYGLIRDFTQWQRPKKPSYVHPLPNQRPTSTEPVDNHSTTSSENPPQRKEEGGRRKEESKQRSREEFDELETRLRSAASVENDPSPGLLDLSPILGLLDGGYSLHEDILPVVKARSVKSKPRSWSFFTEAIKEARGRRLSVAATPAPKAAPIDWDTWVRKHRERGLWQNTLGPEPGYDGCRAPPDILEKHGYLKLEAAE